MRDFQRIKAWQSAHALASALHKRTRQFTKSGYARLRSQLTGAADSTKDTIAEGCGAATKKEFARFLDMAIKSPNETEEHLLSTRELSLLARRMAEVHCRNDRDSQDDLHVSKEGDRERQRMRRVARRCAPVLIARRSAPIAHGWL
jgi:four helix bundle protein